jgi:hypothetical protein
MIPSTNNDNFTLDPQQLLLEMEILFVSNVVGIENPE